MKTKILISTLAVALIGAAWLLLAKPKPVKVTYQTAKVEYGNINTTVTATGTVEPITQVEVGTQVSGIVNNIYVDYNSTVHKGQVIAELDKINLKNELASKECNLNICETEYNYELKNYTRTKTLYEKGLVSDSEYETAFYTYSKAENNYQIAKNEVAKAKTNLGYATIYAPIDGVVLSKAVEEGQTVAASFSTPTLFVIAEDLTQMRLIADVDEADIGGVTEGQRVTFTVDAYPNSIFNGQVVQVRQEATTTSNVVTYQVVINAPNDDLKLKPGLTASVTIFTMEKNNILLVPNKALSFSPSSAPINPTDTIIDCTAQQKVWIQQGNTLKAYPIQTGLSIGSHTELISGLAQGTEVITEVINNTPKAATQNNSAQQSPFMPGPPGKK